MLVLPSLVFYFSQDIRGSYNFSLVTHETHTLGVEIAIVPIPLFIGLE